MHHNRDPSSHGVMSLWEMVRLVNMLIVFRFLRIIPDIKVYTRQLEDATLISLQLSTKTQIIDIMSDIDLQREYTDITHILLKSPQLPP